MATSGQSVPASGNKSIDGLLCGYEWKLGSDRTLTYSFASNISVSAAERATVRAALASWEAVANIHFREVSSGGNLLYRPYISADSGELGSAYLPVGSSVDGEFGINTNSQAPNYLNPGEIGRETIIHEIGHALGLKHPFESYNGFPSYTDAGLGSEDSTLYTVMSYNDYSKSFSSGHAITPMLADVRAIQYLYGINPTTNSGDTLYALAGDNTLQTIWDTGGNDLLDGSALSAALKLDLRAGTYSYVGGSSVVGIDDGVVIELARGGSGADTITGNTGDNVLSGNAGADLLAGNSGNDVLSGNAGIDTLYGNAGADYMRGGQDGDQIFGGTEDDQVFGDLGNDLVRGDRGADTVQGGQNEDTCYGGQGDDLVYGDLGNDLVSGDLGNDVLSGGGGADVFAVRPGHGYDVIVDFNAAEGDRLQILPGTSYVTGPLANACAIDFGNGMLVELRGIDWSQIQSSWFVYA